MFDQADNHPNPPIPGLRVQLPEFGSNYSNSLTPGIRVVGGDLAAAPGSELFDRVEPFDPRAEPSRVARHHQPETASVGAGSFGSSFRIYNQEALIYDQEAVICDHGAGTYGRTSLGT